MAFGKLLFCIIIFAISTGFVRVKAQKTVIVLTEDNWSEILSGEWLVEFYAPWCPACKALEHKWNEFAQLGPGLGIKVGAVDVTTSPGLSGRFMVTALPTIFHVINGEFRQYKSSRDKDSFTSFIEDKKWQQVEPIPKWKSPDSIQMGVVSSFFKLSQMLRHVHNKLTEEYGLPSFCSYLIFALATVTLGAILGLVLVCAIDLFYPPKCTQTMNNLNVHGKDKDSDNELDDEDIKDDLVDDATTPERHNSGDEAHHSPAPTDGAKTKRRKNARLDI
ncbi:unnamed protein product [Phaedon cochleariae]|uniref:Thioredoxin domain-containing protein n=1 Tax=Phaedon cochleariae TaxID=80249 RepID=A0A9P0DS05_PHACE|nr:unnamed protein product [Phaedon cochleariae]